MQESSERLRKRVTQQVGPMKPKIVRLRAGGDYGLEGLKLLARPPGHCCLQGFPSGESAPGIRKSFRVSKMPRKYYPETLGRPGSSKMLAKC